tara:strand:- start:299792 stop:300505 length:714 start_codon:yes stop_codon:yes gene_type:complete
VAPGSFVHRGAAWATAGGWAGFAEEGGCGFAEGFEGAEVEGRLGGFGGSRGGGVGALTPALSQQTGRGRKTPSVAARHLPHRRGGGGLGEGELVGEVGGFLEGSEGLEVEVGLDGWGSRGVDGLDRFDRGLVVGGLGECVELREGEAVDLADEDGTHRGIEEVLEEGFGEGREGRALTPALSPRERGEVEDPLRPLRGHLPHRRGGGGRGGVLLCVCVRLALHCAPLCLWWGLGNCS